MHNSVFGISGRSVLAENFAVFHDEGGVGKDGDGFQGVAGDGDDVGVEVGFELADLVGPVEEFGAIEEAGFEGVGGAHAVLDHEFVFAGLGAVGKGADVGAYGEGDAGGHLSFELGCVEGEFPVDGLGAVGGVGVLTEILADGEGGDGVDLLFAHLAHGFRGEIVAVVDAGDAGGYGVAGAGFAGAVDAYAGAGAVGFGDGGGELGFGVLEGGGEGVPGEVVAAGFVDLGEVCALFALFAHDGDDFVRVVGAVGVREEVFFGVEAGEVFVAAVDVDGIAADAHAGAGNEAGVDGIADGDVGAACAFGTHVAFGGETGHHVGSGGGGGEEGALGDGLFDGLEGLVAGVEEEVDVGVDEAGHEGGGA